eukprot:Tamp_22649.p1 GENE.Tamp_22649~~Tamp_22649.p1  ORF type:complete len:158 (-),score=32.20 Tamp_22649:226-699(-)
MMPRGTLEMTSRQEAGGAIQGLLFDCDGTLVNSMPMWADNWVETCSEFGLALDHERFYSLAGLTIEETLEALCREQGKQVNAEEFFARKDVLAAHSVELVTEISPVAQVLVACSSQHAGLLHAARVNPLTVCVWEAAADDCELTSLCARQQSRILDT